MTSKWDKYGPQPEGTGDLLLAGSHLRTGLQVIGSLAVLSLILCSGLFFFITYRLIDGRLRSKARSKQSSLRHDGPNMAGQDSSGMFALESPMTPKPPPTPSQTAIRLGSMEASHKTATQIHYDSFTDDGRQTAAGNIGQNPRGYNPLLVLIYMLLLADILQSASMIPNLVWVAQNAITVRSDTCWAQGWLRSQGDMASSMFAAAVSVNTWLIVVKQYTIPNKVLWVIVGSIWSFSFLIVAAGVWAAHNGTGHGGYFARVSDWCWISSEYADTRLWSHFGWVLACFSTILISYLSTAISISLSRPWYRVVEFRSTRTSGHHPAFLIYPLVYFVCCLPMTLGPLILLTGVTIHEYYFILAGALIASNGFLDVLVWSSTMVFLAPKELQKAGLEDFRFMRTDSVKYGNIVWVEGGGKDGGDQGRRHSRPKRTGFLSLASFSTLRSKKSERLLPGQEPDRFSGRREASYLDDSGIQIETSTSVVVEEAANSTLTGRTPRQAGPADNTTVPARAAQFF